MQIYGQKIRISGLEGLADLKSPLAATGEHGLSPTRHLSGPRGAAGGQRRGPATHQR